MTKTDILQYLRKSGGFVSGEEISRHFGVSRAAVWKVITALREDGYAIDSVTKKGYHLAEAPDLLSEAEIREGLHTTRIGTHIFSFDTVDSTNEEAKRQGQAGAPDGSVFVADQQTGGKGRLGRLPEGRASGSPFCSGRADRLCKFPILHCWQDLPYAARSGKPPGVPL